MAERLVHAVAKTLGKKTGTKVQTLDQGAFFSDVVDWIPSGFPDLDRILGGGWPVGRASEIAGQEGHGKSALTHMAIRECQRRGGTPVLLDFEVALDDKKIRSVGIDKKNLVYIVPDHLQDGWNAVWALMDDLKKHPPEQPTLIVWDSVAAAVPREELEGDSGDASVGLVARLMRQGCRRMYKRIAEVNAHMMWVNQYISKVGGVRGRSFSADDQRTTSGGGGPKYAASIRVDCTKVLTLKPTVKKGVPPCGFVIQTRTNKCRLAPPFQRTEWVLDFGDGPSEPLTRRHLLMETKRIKSVGAGFYRGDWSDVQFLKRDWRQVLRENADFRKGADRALREVVQAGGVWAWNDQHTAKDDEESDAD